VPFVLFYLGYIKYFSNISYKRTKTRRREIKMDKETLKIYTTKDLSKVEEFMLNCESPGYIVKIMEDLDFEDNEWMPIGNQNIAFEGEFDGQNHILKNLKINLPSCLGVGLISYNTGYIHNLCLDNTCCITGFDYVGSICGSNESQIANCKSAATIKGNDYVGGICGGSASAFEKDETIKESSFYGEINAHNMVGGICGDFIGDGINLTNIGTVNGKIYVGGICGASEGKLHDVKNIGSVNGRPVQPSRPVGIVGPVGIAGWAGADEGRAGNATRVRIRCGGYS
jgi:hypothetical protein